MAWMIPIVSGNNNRYRRNNGVKVASVVLLLFGLLIFFLAFIGFNNFEIRTGIQPWIISSITFFTLIIISVSFIVVIVASINKKYENKNKASIYRKNLIDLFSNYQTKNETQKVNPYVKRPEELYQIKFSKNEQKNNITYISNIHYCRYCGNKVDNNAIYCHQCGIKIE